MRRPYLWTFARERAGDRCEYCRMPRIGGVEFQLEHIRPKQHRGADDESNIAFTCARCNLVKGPNAAGFDPLTDELTRLYDPRTDEWSEHFGFDGVVVVGRTAVGRTTVDLLRMNSDGRVARRQALSDLGYQFGPRVGKSGSP